MAKFMSMAASPGELGARSLARTRRKELLRRQPEIIALRLCALAAERIPMGECKAEPSTKRRRERPRHVKATLTRGRLGTSRCPGSIWEGRVGENTKASVSARVASVSGRGCGRARALHVDAVDVVALSP